MDPKEPPRREDEAEQAGRPSPPPDPDRPTDDVWKGNTLTEPGSGSSGS